MKKNDLKYSDIEGFTGNPQYNQLNSMINNSKDFETKITKLKNDIGADNDNDILTKDGLLKPTGRLVDVARQDVQIMLIQQNTLYMIGTITIATLLITAILISK